MTRHSILVVEDEGVVAQDIQSSIARIGHQVAGWATSGEEAISLAEQHHPDLVLMDIRLDGEIDGITAAEEIHQRLDIPVVFLTAFADDETLTRAKLVGPFGYILKPFDESDLRIAIEIGTSKHEFDQKVAEARRELAEESEFLNSLFETIPAPVMVVDSDQKIRMVNRALERDFAGARETIIDVCPGDALDCPRAIEQPNSCGTLDECITCQLRPTIDEALDGGKVDRRRCQFEFQADGEVRELTLMISARPLDRKDGRLAIVILEDITELNGLREAMRGEGIFAGIVGNTQAMFDLFESIREVAEVDVPVAILGESGVGKELVARAIHRESKRASGPLEKVNCAAVPSELIESELFGHEAGAFTGATRQRRGKFERAGGGTLFLDEVGDMPLSMQAKLLRVLQEREIERVGGSDTIVVDVRVVAATNRDLEQACQEETFRADLYDRLNVLPLNVPPLRARREDVPLLTAHFLGIAASVNDRPEMSISEGALATLSAYSFPGNVRELRNVIERLVILNPDEHIDEDAVKRCLGAGVAGPAGALYRPGVPFRVLVEESERDIIEQALRHHGGQMAATARALKLERSYLYKKCKALGLRSDKGDAK